jgi:hypothetical protein
MRFPVIHLVYFLLYACVSLAKTAMLLLLPRLLYTFIAGVSQSPGTYRRFALQWTVLSASCKALYCSWLRCCLWCRTHDPGAHCVSAACYIEARQFLSAILKNLYALPFWDLKSFVVAFCVSSGSQFVARGTRLAASPGCTLPPEPIP